MRRFYLNRIADPSGKSGTGRVMDGVVFPSGQVVCFWRIPKVNMITFESWEDFTEVFLEDDSGMNVVVWIDMSDPPAFPP